MTLGQGRIAAIDEEPGRRHGPFILPGFVDAHVHVESSMLVPSEFAKMAVIHGTVATVSDPHEIANVLGLAGVEYMLDNAASTPLLRFAWRRSSTLPRIQLFKRDFVDDNNNPVSINKIIATIKGRMRCNTTLSWPRLPATP